MPFLVLCFSEWGRGCGCLVRVRGRLAVTGCWAARLGDGVPVRSHFRRNGFGFAKHLVPLQRRGGRLPFL